MSMIIQPFLPTLYLDLGLAVVSILYGLRWECHYTAWISVVMNVVFTGFFLFENPLPLMVLIALLIYIAFGVVVAKRSVDWAYSAFGTKTFGSLALTACLFKLGVLSWLVSVLTPIKAFFEIGVVYLIVWIIISVFVHFLGWYYFGRDN